MELAAQAEYASLNNEPTTHVRQGDVELFLSMPYIRILWKRLLQALGYEKTSLFEGNC